SRVVDEPISRRIDGRAWTPGNYDGRYMGDITLRRSIELSRNIPAIKLAEEVGPRTLQAFYRDVGLTKATNLPSASLGAFNVTPTELAGAYTVFPGGGEPSLPRVVESITDADGKLIIAYPPESEPVASARGAAMSTAVLQGVIQNGTGRAAAKYGVTGPVGGKTGTTDQTRDAWFVGFTPSTSVAVWVGHDRGANLGLTGSKAALPIWSHFVVASGIQGGRFEIPDGMHRRALCTESGLVARGACPHSYDEVLSDGQGPKRKCDQHGGPVVEARSWLGGLFGKKKADVEGQGALGQDASGVTEP
ncbi:MAG: membrane peptidoglycan carboxypeptidase, partial [Kiritimatiellia bacterium]